MVAGPVLYNVSVEMKKYPKIFAGAGILLMTITLLALGFVMGNASATRRTGQTGLYKNVAILKAIEDGNTDKAKNLCTTLISGGYRFLKSKPFWLVSLQDHFNVDSDGLYERVADKAEEISRNRDRDSVPLDQALKERLGRDVKVEYNIK